MGLARSLPSAASSGGAHEPRRRLRAGIAPRGTAARCEKSHGSAPAQDVSLSAELLPLWRHS
eukprot:5538627-Prymnesium_polylepis.1